jgi:hypothetical protein
VAVVSAGHVFAAVLTLCVVALALLITAARLGLL